MVAYTTMLILFQCSVVLPVWFNRFVDILLSVISEVNISYTKGLRQVACESLRELSWNHPRLLHYLLNKPASIETEEYKSLLHLMCEENGVCAEHYSLLYYTVLEQELLLLRSSKRLGDRYYVSLADIKPSFCIKPNDQLTLAYPILNESDDQWIDMVDDPGILNNITPALMVLEDSLEFFSFVAKLQLLPATMRHSTTFKLLNCNNMVGVHTAIRSFVKSCGDSFARFERSIENGSRRKDASRIVEKIFCMINSPYRYSWYRDILAVRWLVTLVALCKEVRELIYEPSSQGNLLIDCFPARGKVASHLEGEELHLSGLTPRIDESPLTLEVKLQALLKLMKPNIFEKMWLSSNILTVVEETTKGHLSKKSSFIYGRYITWNFGSFFAVLFRFLMRTIANFSYLRNTNGEYVISQMSQTAIGILCHKLRQNPAYFVPSIISMLHLLENRFDDPTKFVLINKIISLINRMEPASQIRFYLPLLFAICRLSYNQCNPLLILEPLVKLVTAYDVGSANEELAENWCSLGTNMVLICKELNKRLSKSQQPKLIMFLKKLQSTGCYPCASTWNAAKTLSTSILCNGWGLDVLYGKKSSCVDDYSNNIVKKATEYYRELPEKDYKMSESGDLFVLLCDDEKIILDEKNYSQFILKQPDIIPFLESANIINFDPAKSHRRHQLLLKDDCLAIFEPASLAYYQKKLPLLKSSHKSFPSDPIVPEIVQKPLLHNCVSSAMEEATRPNGTLDVSRSKRVNETNIYQTISINPTDIEELKTGYFTELQNFQFIKLPFDLRLNTSNKTESEIFGLRISFRAHNHLQHVIDPLTLPYLQQQQHTEKGGQGEEVRKIPSVYNLILNVKIVQPVPTKFYPHIQFSDNNDTIYTGQLPSFKIQLQDLFQPLPEIPSSRWFFLFQHMWRDVSMSSCVKLLEIPEEQTYTYILDYLGPFIIPLDSTPDRETDDGVQSVIDMCLEFESEAFNFHSEFRNLHSHVYRRKSLVPSANSQEFCWTQPIILDNYLYTDRNESVPNEVVNRNEINTAYVIIFIPPKYHLLMRFTISSQVSVVRIFTDHKELLKLIDGFFHTWQ